MQKIFIKNKWIFLLVIISFIPLADLLRPGLPLGHDTQDHVARIANFYQNIQEGNIVPRWAGNLNWGYGHPIIMFLYPFPSYLGSFFHFLNFSLVDSVKIVFMLGFLLSGFSMFLWIKNVFGAKEGFVAGLLYTLAPYRFVDLYVRGAIGENFFFIWPPLVCYFLYKLSREYKWIYLAGGAFSTALMMLSHNALTIMFFPFVFFYALTLLLTKNKNKLLFAVYCLLFTVFGFALSAFFWLPAFFEGKYTLRDIVTTGEYVNRFETINRLIYSDWTFGGSGSFSVQIGILQWLFLLAAPILLVYLLRRKDKNSKLVLLSIISFAVSIFLMLPISKPIYETITILQKFQFPWRFLSLAVFSPAIIGGILISLVLKKKKTIFTFLILVVLLLLNKDYWRAKDYQIKPDIFYSGVYHGTTDTGESAPIWSVRFMEKEPKAPLEIVEGSGRVKIIERKSTKHVYDLDITSFKARVLENTLYFPGWFVYVDGKELNLVDVLFQDPNYRGLLNFFLDKGNHRVEIVFRETRLRQIADIISGISLFFLAFLWPIFLWRLPHTMKKKI